MEDFLADVKRGVFLGMGLAMLHIAATEAVD